MPDDIIGYRIDLTLDPDQLKSLRERLLPDKDTYNRVLQRAINAGQRAGQKVMLNLAQAALGIPVSTLKQRIKGRGATLKGHAVKDDEGNVTGGRTGMYARARAFGGGGSGWNGMRPSNFGWLASKVADGFFQTGFHGIPFRLKDGTWRTRAGTSVPGVGAAMVGGRSAVIVPGGFIATMKTGHEGLFVRKPGAAREIMEARTLSPGEVVMQQGGLPTAAAAATEAANAVLSVEMAALAAGKGAA